MSEFEPTRRASQRQGAASAATAFALLFGGGVLLAGCSGEADSMEEVYEETGENLEDAGDEIGDMTEDAIDETEDALDEIDDPDYP